MKKIFTPRVNGFLFSNLIGISIIWITRHVMTENADPTIIFSEFVIVPILMGMAGGWFWQDLHLNSRKLVAYCIYNSLIAIALSFLFLGEGVICLIIVSPLIFTFMLTGGFIGRNMYKRKNDKLNVSVVLVLALIFVFDAYSKHEYEIKVTDTILIHATPDKIWKNVVSFKKIKKPNAYWLFRIGMPSPIESTVTGNYKGAGRKCIFSNGYVFDEKISTYQPQQDLTFDIVNQPKDPEIMNHIAIVRGQFLLRDNGDGTTTLVGNSWYNLYVFPVWYYDIWAKSITRNVHKRVMEHIKELSEE
jgi:hypothetical protein